MHCTHFDRKYIKKSRNQNQFYSQLLLMAINFETFLLSICGKYVIMDKTLSVCHTSKYRALNGNLRFKIKKVEWYFDDTYLGK